MSSDRSNAFDARAAEQQAADWVARRDRGLTAAEQDDYLQWLREDARHAALVARHEDTVRRMQRLAHWQPTHSSEPNPDLFARPPQHWWRRLAAWSAVAAACVLGTMLWWRVAHEAPARAPATTFLRVNERQVLADGSVVELRDGSRIEVRFSDVERRVRLIGGEAQFTVTKNPTQPFVVEAGGVAVRAIGTVFAVRLDAAAVDVLVTEGKVRVEPPASPDAPSVAPHQASLVSASQRAVVSLATAAPEPQVTAVTPEQIKEVLGWQAPRFQFYETPLSDAMAEFNQRNRLQLVAGDPAVSALRIGGTFRADNVDGFVSLLQLTLGIRSERRSDTEIALLSPR